MINKFKQLFSKEGKYTEKKKDSKLSLDRVIEFETAVDPSVDDTILELFTKDETLYQHWVVSNERYYNKPVRYDLNLDCIKDILIAIGALPSTYNPGIKKYNEHIEYYKSAYAEYAKNNNLPINILINTEVLKKINSVCNGIVLTNAVLNLNDFTILYLFEYDIKGIDKSTIEYLIEDVIKEYRNSIDPTFCKNPNVSDIKTLHIENSLVELDYSHSYKYTSILGSCPFIIPTRILNRYKIGFMMVELDPDGNNLLVHTRIISEKSNKR